ncbi:MAG: CAP domain-containing protein [bacterium]|nr:CAP domain-containing protein [bacterium]
MRTRITQRFAKASISLITALLIFAPVSTIHGDEASHVSAMVAELVESTNTERLALGLDALERNTVLNRAAQMKADDMAANGYFSHTSPNNMEPWDWMDRAGYAYIAAGENLAVNFMSPDKTVGAWMESPSHRANIEKGKYTEIGTGVAFGMYKGREAAFVVQMYAKPR